MADLEIRVGSCTFVRPRRYFVSVQLDSSKRIRTEVSESTSAPVFQKVFVAREFLLNEAPEEVHFEVFGLDDDDEPKPVLLGTSSVRLSGASTILRDLTFVSAGSTPVGTARVEIRQSETTTTTKKKRSSACDVVVLAHDGTKGCRLIAAVQGSTKVVADDWNSSLGLQVPRSVARDASLYIDVEEDGKRRARTMIPLKRLQPFDAYTLQLTWPDVTSLVTVTKHDDAAVRERTAVTITKLQLRLEEEGRYRCVVRLVDPDLVDTATGVLRGDRRPPVFPAVAVTATDGAVLGVRVDDRGHLDMSESHRKPTLSAAASSSSEDGVVSFNDNLTFLVDQKKTHVVAIVEVYNPEYNFLGWAMLPLRISDDDDDESIDASAPILRHEADGSLLDHEARVLGQCAATFVVVKRRQSNDVTVVPAPMPPSLQEAPFPMTSSSSSSSRYDDDVVRVARLENDIEERDDTIGELQRRCRHLEHDKQRLVLEWQTQEALRRKDFATMRRFLETNDDVLAFDGDRDVEAQLKLLAMMYRQVKLENDGLVHLQSEEKRLRKAQKDLEAKYADLVATKKTQELKLLKMEKEVEKSDAYRTTIKIQETVIAKLEDLVDGKLRTISRHRIDEAKQVEAQLQKLQAQAGSGLSDADAAKQAADHASTVAKKDFHIETLEAALADEKKQVAKLRLRMFELEMMNEYGQPPPILDSIDLVNRIRQGPASPEAEVPTQFFP